ncbi:hypothetical protein HQ524_03970 [Candidatus Uhrbacteria bacterium]|nr:hypothetical protein [Candidatus Uhrbacteria bacterium]
MKLIREQLFELGLVNRSQLELAEAQTPEAVQQREAREICARLDAAFRSDRLAREENAYRERLIRERRLRTEAVLEETARRMAEGLVKHMMRQRRINDLCAAMADLIWLRKEEPVFYSQRVEDFAELCARLHEELFRAVHN